MTARAKRPYKAKLRTVTASLFTEPIDDFEGTWNGKVPVIDAVMPDGREVHITFESPSPAGTTSRGRYTYRMRLLGQALTAEADRRDADPKR
jgi:hypothetical protein